MRKIWGIGGEIINKWRGKYGEEEGKWRGKL